MTDPRNDPDDAYAAFMGMPASEWQGLVGSLAGGGVLTPPEQAGFERAARERRRTDNLPELQHRPIDRRRAQHSLDSLDSFIDQAHADAIRLQERGDVVGLGDGLERLRAILAKLRDLEREVEDMTAGLMDRKLIVEEGIGMERRQSTNRKAWQSEELLRRLVGDRLVDPSTGENLYETLVACVPFTGSLGWRVTALRERGIQIDEFCDETPGRVSVRVWRGEDDG